MRGEYDVGKKLIRHRLRHSLRARAAGVGPSLRQ